MFRSPLADGVIILVIILLFVGPKRLPMLSRSVGESIKEFKGGVAERQDEKQHLDAAPAPQSTTEATEKRETVS